MLSLRCEARGVFASVLVAAALMTTGCATPFLHGVGSGLVRDEGLVGEWVNDGETVTHAKIASGINGYAVALTVHHKGELRTSVTLDLTLSDAGGARFADLFLSRDERDKLVGTYGFLVIPAHQVMKIHREGDKLHVWTLRETWTAPAGADPGIAHDTAIVGGTTTTLVTASPGQVREWLGHRADDSAAFGEEIVFYRSK